MNVNTIIGIITIITIQLYAITIITIQLYAISYLFPALETYSIPKGMYFLQKPSIENCHGIQFKYLLSNYTG
jgi:hypothetical protein